MKAIASSLSEIPEALRSEYDQKDGKFILRLEGDLPGHVKASDLAASNGKLVEFRDKNIALLKEVAALAGVSEASDLSPLKSKMDQFAGLDIEELKTLKGKYAELEKKGVKGADDFKAAIDAAVNPLKQELIKEREERVKVQKAADLSMLRTTVGERFLKVGGKAKALDYIVNQAAQVFKVEDGAVKALPHRFSSNSNTPGEPLSVEEWISSMTAEADFAFEPSRGGGANGSGNGAGAGARPGVRQIVNPTPQQLGELAKDIRAGKVEIVNQ